MTGNIYSKIGKEVGRDARFVRAVAHHPFEFFSKVMEDPQDHRPMRFRYLGIFFVKPYWRKGLRSVKEKGLPNDGDHIWARVPETKYNKVYINLKLGIVHNGKFYADDESLICSVDDIKFWVKYS